MTREYVDNCRTRITTYTMTKIIEYEDETDAKFREEMLDILRVATFKHILLPEFEYSRNGSEVTIVTEYIKGWYCAEPLKLYDEIVLREEDYTFTDPHPSNFITCCRTFETYAIDLDSYTKKWPFQKMHDMFIRKWSQKLKAHSWMIEQIQQLKSSQTDSAREVDHP